MNKIIIRHYIQALATLKSHKIWKDFLNENGVSGNAINKPTIYEIINKAFKNTFATQVKDNKIILEDISKTYENGFKAVDNFSLSIEPNDFVCLLGPSGCGKTTVLRMMAGLDQITGGRYFIGNREMNAVHPSERKTAMVFQNYALYPFMSVYNNIAFGLKLKTYKNDLFLAKIEEIARLKQSHYQEISDLKYYIKTLKNPLRDEINEVKIKLKKAKIKGDENAINKFKTSLEKLTIDRQNLLKNNENEIRKTLATILELKKLQKDSYLSKRKELTVHNKRIDEQIASLEIEAKKYFEHKKGDLEILSQKKRNNLSKQKQLNTENIKYLKGKLLEIKNVKKSKSLNVNENIVKIEKEIEESKHVFNEKMKNLTLEQSKIIQEIGIIKNKHHFTIGELRSQKVSHYKLVNDAAKLAVIWKKTIPARVWDLANIVGISNFLKRKPAALSGGQRQRVALIRAISKDAQLFLFDEPLSNLDAKLRGTMRTEIKKIHERIGATSLYVTHDQIEAMTMANKVVVMNVGYIQQVGDPKDLYDNPANMFVARFIGTPTMNMLICNLKNQSVVFSNKYELKLSLSKTKLDLLDKASSKEVVLGVRAQDVKIEPSKPKNSSSFKAIVDTLELIGSEYVVSVKSEIGNLKAITPNSAKLSVGLEVSVTIDTSKVHVFDRSSGFSITSIINDETRKAQEIWHEGVNERIDNKKLLERETKEKVRVTKLVTKQISSVTTDGRQKALLEKLSKRTKHYEDYDLVELDDNQGQISS